MAMNEMRAFHSNKRWIKQLIEVDPGMIVFDYDRRSDTLFIDLRGEPRSSIEVVLDDHVLMSVDPETEELVGIQIEGFLAHVIYELPTFLDIADLIGLTPEEVTRVQQRVLPARRTRAVLESLLGHVEDPLNAMAV